MFLSCGSYFVIGDTRSAARSSHLLRAIRRVLFANWTKLTEVSCRVYPMTLSAVLKNQKSLCKYFVTNFECAFIADFFIAF